MPRLRAQAPPRPAALDGHVPVHRLRAAAAQPRPGVGAVGGAAGAGPRSGRARHPGRAVGRGGPHRGDGGATDGVAAGARGGGTGAGAVGVRRARVGCRRPGTGAAGGDVAPRMSRVLRLLVWVLAVPLGGAVALLGARLIGFVDGSRLIDMISGDGGWSRYTRAFVLVPIWALISAGLVQGAEHLRNRLRARRTATAADAGGGPEPAAVPAPSGQSSRRGRRAGS